MLQIEVSIREQGADKSFLLPLVRKERRFPGIFSFKSVPCKSCNEFSFLRLFIAQEKASKHLC